MANEEAFTLDGLALNDGTTFGVVNVSWPPPRQRQDWIGAADSEAQLLFRNPLHENRKVTLRVAVIQQSTMDLALGKIASALDKLQKASQYTDGIALTWTPSTATLSCTFDALSGEITDLPIDWENGWLARAPEFTIELTCKPYWRGTETLTSTGSSSTPFVALEIANVTGDVPALGRLIVTDTASQSRRHVEWGLEGPLTYNNATSLLVDSDNMVTSGFGGTQSTRTGAYDPNASGNSVITAAVYGGAVAVCGTGNLSHIGSFRVKARVWTNSLSTRVRLAWQANDGPFTANAWAEPAVDDSWNEIDLGVITIPITITGTQRWQGRIEAHETSGGATVDIDYLTLIPTSDGYGKSRATYAPQAGVLTGVDSFVGTTAGSNLNGRTAVLGGAWATSGSTTDFQFADNLVTSDGIESIARSTLAAETTGRFAILGTSNYTDTQVEARAFISAADVEAGVIARWTDASNHLRLRATFTTPGYTSSTENLYIEQLVAGVVTIIAQSTWTRPTHEQTVYFRLIAYASGRVIGYMLSSSQAVLGLADGTASTVATGGTLATGKPGLYDRATSASSGSSRAYTTFSVATPAAEPIALFSGRNMQVRYDDVFRQDSTGTYVGRPPSYRGSRFLVPVGTSRVLVKARRGDIETVADDFVTDATQIQVGWTPRGLAVPR